MRRGNLSFGLLRKYLGMLVGFGLLEVRGEAEKSYTATDKGGRFLQDYHKLEKYSGMAESKKRALETSLAVAQ